MRPKLEFFFDCSSPWTYLAYTQIEELAARSRAELLWRPILVGGVFNAVNGSVYEQRDNPVLPKFRYYMKDMQDWARLYNLKIGTPPVFPVNSVKAMRGAFFALENGIISSYVGEVFRIYWGELKDISSDDVLRAICDRVGLNDEAFFAAITAPASKKRLRDNTDELIVRGGFGSPTMFVNTDDMYFGNDRLALVENALNAAEPA